MKKVLLLSCFSLISFLMKGQQIEACDDPNTIVLSSFCGDACVLCDMDGYVGNNSSVDLGEAPPGFCASALHNTQWVGFVAGTEDVTIDISVVDCIQGQGLQIGIYNTTDCDNFNLVSNCENQIEEGEIGTFVNTEPLIPGGIYFLVIDGAFGDICDFEVDVTAGSTQAPTVAQISTTITAPDSGCPGEIVDISADAVEGAGAYYWTLDGEEIATDLESMITLPLDDGVYTLCVTPYNPCSQGVETCTTIEVITPGTNVFEEATICDGDVHTTYEMDFSVADQYHFTVENPGMCPDVVQLDLTVIPLPEVFLTEQVCPGFNFQVGSSFYTETGMYMDVLTGDNGCDSLVYLDLEVVGTDFVTFVEGEICEGETFEVAGDELTNEGNYSYTLTDVYGCDSLIDVILTVHPVNNDLIEDEICEGNAYDFYGTDYFETGEYVTVVPDENGCDFTVTLQLVVNPVEEVEIDASICQGQAYTVGSSQYTTAGFHETFLLTEKGCDSVVYLNLQVVESLLEVEDLTICAGESVMIDGQTATTSGTYTSDHISTQGCDSTYQLNLTVLPAITSTINPAICQGQSFSIGMENFITTGNYEVVLTANNGCDSTVTVQLNVDDILTGYEAITLCAGDSVTVDGTAYNATGLYEFPYTTSEGCDSLHQLDLTVLAPINTTLNQEICVGTSFTVGMESFDTGGMYEVVLTSAANCDSTVFLNLTMTNTLVNAYSEAICEGDTTYITNIPYATTGNYEEMLTTPEGCDSLVQLALTVIPNTASTVTASICDGETYTLEGQNFTTPGPHLLTIPSAAGCDSVITLDLTVFPVPEVTINPQICSGQTFEIGGQIFDETGIYNVTLTTVDNCDSLVTVNLTVTTVIIEMGAMTICEGDSVIVGNSVYNTTGNYENPFVTADNCDSLYQLDLTVIPTTYATIDPIICNGESFEIGTSTYSATGTYEETILSAAGCDSVVTVNLFVAPTPEVMIQASICEDGSYTVGDSTLTTEAIHTIVLATEFGCDSTVILDLIITDFYETNLMIALCQGESYQVGMDSYSVTGMYQNTFTAQDGCDSIVNLDLLINPLLNETVDATICEGETFSIAGVEYASAGTHTETIPSLVTSCDSTITLNLTVNPVYDINEAATICDGESVMIGDSTYTVSGVFVTALSSVNACDSIVTLDLEVIPIPEENLTEVICDGESFTVGSSTYTTSGMYTDVLTSVVSGCDSIVYLDLTVNPIPETMLTESICDGEAFEVGNEAYTTTGNHTTVLTSLVTGCDSIVYLDLTVNTVYQTSLEETICNDEFFTVGTETFNTTGIHQVLLSSFEGCDSTVTLNLTVIPCTLFFDASNTLAACSGSPSGSIAFTMTEGTPPYNYSWVAQNSGATGAGSIDSNNEEVNLTGLLADNYTIMVIDTNAIEVEITQTVGEPAPININLSPSLFGIYNVSCDGAADGSLTAEVTGGTAPYTFAWGDGMAGETNTGLAAGEHQVVVTDAMGCERVAMASLTAPTTVEGQIDVTQPDCFEDLSGQATVAMVSGGTSPFLYAVDGGAYSSSNLFSNLAIGTHLVTVQDVNGCEWQQEIQINQAAAFTVDLGEDILMEFGETVQLEAISIGSDFQWSGGPIIDCPGPDMSNCAKPFISPEASTLYSVTVTNEKGCTATDEIRVTVEKPRNIFIPTAFSPNDDGVNDLFGINAGNGVAQVKSFLIFNRWGESIYEAYNFDPNSIAHAWDGKQNGEALNAAVYVYFAEIAFIDGVTILYKGDVVLLQ